MVRDSEKAHESDYLKLSGGGSMVSWLCALEPSERAGKVIEFFRKSIDENAPREEISRFISDALFTLQTLMDYDAYITAGLEARRLFQERFNGSDHSLRLIDHISAAVDSDKLSEKLVASLDALAPQIGDLNRHLLCMAGAAGIDPRLINDARSIDDLGERCTIAFNRMTCSEEYKEANKMFHDAISSKDTQTLGEMVRSDSIIRRVSDAMMREGEAEEKAVKAEPELIRSIKLVLRTNLAPVKGYLDRSMFAILALRHLHKRHSAWLPSLAPIMVSYLRTKEMRRAHIDSAMMDEITRTISGDDENSLRKAALLISILKIRSLARKD